jgi:hypothetical protein
MLKVVPRPSGGAVYFGSSCLRRFPLHVAAHHDSDMERPCQAPPGLDGVLNSAGFPTNGRKAGLCLSGSARCRVIPPEPPVAMRVWPERSGAVKGAPQVGAAKRTLDGEHRSGTDQAFDGRLGGITILLVSFERWFWTAGPMTAQEHTRRLITLIFAGRNRMVMIRRELPRTKRADWVRKPYRIES